ncbi:MAG: WYL domain-containing protein [Planctomycetes bacterium]|nr:WYL domain-containing protein [Planctomycetota bacterium]
MGLGVVRLTAAELRRVLAGSGFQPVAPGGDLVGRAEVDGYRIEAVWVARHGRVDAEEGLELRVFAPGSPGPTNRLSLGEAIEDAAAADPAVARSTDPLRRARRALGAFLEAHREGFDPGDPSRLERQIALVCHLREAQGPRSLREIRRALRSHYGGLDPESARRRFSRDLEALEAAGVQVVRGRDAAGEPGGETTVATYGLPRPPGDLSLRLDRGDIEVLSLLHRMGGRLRGGPLSRPLRLALLKVAYAVHRDLAAALDRSGIAFDAGPEGRPERPLAATEGAALEAFVGATAARRRLVFGYTTLDGRRARRTVEPYGVYHAHGAWYGVGRSAGGAGGPRTFKLCRVQGPVEVCPEGGYDIPDGFRVAELARRRPWDLDGAPRLDARLEVAATYLPDCRDLFDEVGGGGEWVGALVRRGDARALARWVLENHGRVRLLGPEAALDRWRAELEALRAIYARPAMLATLEPAGPGWTDEAAEGPPAALEPRDPWRQTEAARLDLVLSALAALTVSPREEVEGVAVRRLDLGALAQGLGLDPKTLRADMEVACLALAAGGGRMARSLDILGHHLVLGLPGGEASGAPPRLSPPRLSLLEALALQHHLATIPDRGGPWQAEVERLRSRLGRAMRRADPDLAERLEAGYAGFPTSAAPPEVYRAVREAVEHRRALSMTYYTEGRRAAGKCVVEPLALRFGEAHWYLSALTRPGGRRRDYRLDRVREAVVLEDPCRADPGPEPPRGPRDWALVRFTGASAVEVLETIPGARPEQGTRAVLARLEAWGLDYLVGRVLVHGSEAEVVSPERVRRRVREAVAALVAGPGGA